MAKATDTEARFLKAITEHEMTLVGDAGISRQITFKKPTSHNNHFHITTWPGYLAISGDAGCYVFARLPDMFDFFRGSEINPSYWGEKLQAVDRHGGFREFSAASFHEAIKSDFDQWQFDGDDEQEAAARKAAWAALQESDLAEDEAPESVEDAIRRAMDYACPVSGNTFNDFWDHDLQDHTYRFLWCCHAIQWAIRKYDALSPDLKASQRPAVSSETNPTRQPSQPGREEVARIIDPGAFHINLQFRHRYCSPLKVEVVQERALAKADAILALNPQTESHLAGKGEL